MVIQRRRFCQDVGSCGIGVDAAAAGPRQRAKARAQPIPSSVVLEKRWRRLWRRARVALPVRVAARHARQGGLGALAKLVTSGQASARPSTASPAVFGPLMPKNGETGALTPGRMRYLKGGWVWAAFIGPSG